MGSIEVVDLRSISYCGLTVYLVFIMAEEHCSFIRLLVIYSRWSYHWEGKCLPEHQWSSSDSLIKARAWPSLLWPLLQPPHRVQNSGAGFPFGRCGVFNVEGGDERQNVQHGSIWCRKPPPLAFWITSYCRSSCWHCHERNGKSPNPE